MKRFLRESSLGLFFGALFLLALTGQAIAGHIAYNDEQLIHGGEAISLGRYLTSSQFGQAVMENWQSEYRVLAGRGSASRGVTQVDLCAVTQQQDRECPGHVRVLDSSLERRVAGANKPKGRAACMWSRYSSWHL